MKIGRSSGQGGERLGVVVSEGGTQKVLDLGAAAKAQGKARVAATMNGFIDGGKAQLGHVCAYFGTFQRRVQLVGLKPLVYEALSY